MVVSREPVCKTCNHDPTNMLTEILHAYNEGQASEEEVENLRESLREGSKEINQKLGELIDYARNHPEGLLPVDTNVIPVLETT